MKVPICVYKTTFIQFRGYKVNRRLSVKLSNHSCAGLIGRKVIKNIQRVCEINTRCLQKVAIANSLKILDSLFSSRAVVYILLVLSFHIR